MTENTHIINVCWICIFVLINNSEYIAHHWLSNITIYFIIPSYQISNDWKPYERTQILILLWNLSPSRSYWKGHLSASPASQPHRRGSALRRRSTLKGSTVMALTSWSYWGKSGRECSAAGSTDNERVCWSCRRWPRRPQAFVDFSRGWWRTYPPSSLWVCAASRRATCQVSGLSSNFHGCAEVTKSRDPGFPFDREEEKPGYLQVLAFSVPVSYNCCPGGF